MSNIVVSIVNANIIKVEFNNYYPTNHDISIAYYNRSTIQKLELKSDRVIVHVLEEGKDWSLALTTTDGCFIVDTVEGITPTDLDDLASKLADLIVV